MSTDLFTYLLLERLKNITKPSLSREEANFEYEAFMRVLSESGLGEEEIAKMQEDIKQLQDEIRRIEGSFSEINSFRFREIRPELVEYLGEIERQIRVLNQKINLQDNIVKLEQRIRLLATRLPSESKDPMQAIFHDYFTMNESLFRTITPESHIWFLERILAEPESIAGQNTLRLTNLYFQYAHTGIIRYLIINALSTQGSKGVQQISDIGFQIIEKFKVISDIPNAARLLVQLIDILLEIPNDEAIEAVTNINQYEIQAQLQEARVSRRIRERLERLSEYYDASIINRLNNILSGDLN